MPKSYVRFPNAFQVSASRDTTCGGTVLRKSLGINSQFRLLNSDFLVRCNEVKSLPIRSAHDFFMIPTICST